MIMLPILLIKIIGAIKSLESLGDVICSESYVIKKWQLTEEGEQVYLSKRLTKKMDVQPGDIFDAHVLLNYADKRDMIKYRAMRVKVATNIAPIFFKFSSIISSLKLGPK